MYMHILVGIIFFGSTIKLNWTKEQSWHKNNSNGKLSILFFGSLNDLKSLTVG